jgi:hypothetical protein
VGWSDICIRNLSARGLLLQGPSPPSPGSYVEVRRGCHIIVARVVWANEQQFGAQAQDLLPIDQIILGADGVPAAAGATNESQVDRRTAPRPDFERSHDASRHLSSAMQFGFMLVVSATLATATYAAVSDALVNPLRIAAASF